MPVLKAGSRLRSQVDTTEVIVVRAPADDLDLRIGGHPVVDQTQTPVAGLTATGGAEAALVGKRYTRAGDDLEILVTKGGTAGLALGDEPLVLKESKPLPASD
jgi:hypothetical protein